MKIQNFENLVNISKKLKANNKSIALCHGVFDFFHYGHLKHFKKAKNLADVLVVTLTADRFGAKAPGRPFFNEKLRAEIIANLECVDYVCINNASTPIEIINKIKPNIYVKGKDYKNFENDLTGNIKLETEAIKKVKGKIYFTNEITFSSSNILNNYSGILNEEQKIFIKKIVNRYSFNDILKYLNLLNKTKILVVGETIIDQYIFLETLNRSGKDTYLATKSLSQENYIGGAASIVKNCSSFSNKVSFVSLVGEKNDYLSFIKKELPKKINKKFFKKRKSPTILKRRFVDYISKNKLFGFYDFNDSEIDDKLTNKIVSYLRKNIYNKYDLVIIADYGHGFINEKIINCLHKISKNIAVNAQVNSSNIGFHSLKKYKKANFLIINENELRHEVRDKEEKIEKIALNFKRKNNYKTLVVTMGKNGALIISKKNVIIKCPSFTSNVIDKVGAGDTMLSIIAPLLTNKTPDLLSIFLGNIAGGISVKNLGNSIGLDKIKLIKYCENLIK